MSNSDIDHIIQSDEEHSNIIDSNMILNSLNKQIDVNLEDFENKVLQATTSQKLINLLETLPRSVFAMGQSHTYNRVIKLLVHENILETLPRHSWNRANKREKSIVINAMRDISKSNHPELFVRLQAAILNKDYKKLPSGLLSNVEDSSVLVNRIVLLAHAIVDPVLLPILNELSQIKINSTEFRPNKLYDLKEKAAMLANSQANSYSNIFVNSDYLINHPDLVVFNPNTGAFQDGEQFYKLLIIMKNKYEKLLTRIAQWSLNTSTSSSMDSTAIECCASGGGSYDYPLFYCYMLWKDKDLRYLTANLSSGIDEPLKNVYGVKRGRSPTNITFHKKRISNDNDYDSQSTTSDNNANYFIPNTPFSVNDSTAIQAYIEKKKAQTNYINQKSEIEKLEYKRRYKEKEIEILKNTIADSKTFDVLDHDRKKVIVDRYYLLIMNQLPDQEFDHLV